MSINDDDKTPIPGEPPDDHMATTEEIAAAALATPIKTRSPFLVHETMSNGLPRPMVDTMVSTADAISPEAQDEDQQDVVLDMISRIGDHMMKAGFPQTGIKPDKLVKILAKGGVKFQTEVVRTFMRSINVHIKRWEKANGR